MNGHAAGHLDDKKGHICPPSDATHPSDRWETLYVCAFLARFTRGRVDGMHSPMDLEDALLQSVPSPVMTDILTRFIKNLRPQTRNIATGKISDTIASVFADFIKTSERTVFWNDARHANDDPFKDMSDGFFSASWDLKLKILRQLVDFQLAHSTDVKAVLDRAWGLTQIKEKRKGPAAHASDVPDPTDANSQENLQLVPIGQDNARKRYWVVDDSPRIWTSTNPWKITAGFQCIASTREQYMGTIEALKASLPPPPKGDKARSKSEQNHEALIEALTLRTEKLDAELARIARAKKKVEQKQILAAQAELRQTRTRRQTRRPDYVYNDGPEDDDGDAYNYRDPEDDEDFDMLADDDEEGTGRGRRSASSRSTDVRRSARTTAGTKRDAAGDTSATWRGERRSTRLGAPVDTQFEEPPPKRARTEESTISDAPSSVVDGAPSASARLKTSGAAALKSSETAVEQFGKKKKSKFWFYAVEPIPGEAPPPPPSTVGSENGISAQTSVHEADEEMNGATSAPDAPTTNGGVVEADSDS